MELKEKILVNYSNDIGSTVEGLVSIGIVTTKEKDLLKYDLYEKSFRPIGFQEVKELILKDVPNYWNIEEAEVDVIIKEKIEEILPIITLEQLEHTSEYITAKANVITDKELKNSLKELLSKNKKRHSKINPKLKKNPTIQAKALVNEDVFIDSISKKYVRYDKEQDLFINLNVADLFNYLTKYFKFEGYEVMPEDLVLFCKANYYYPSVITKTDLPYRYNKNKVYKEILEQFKEDYTIIKAIVDKFE